MRCRTNVSIRFIDLQRGSCSMCCDHFGSQTWYQNGPAETSSHGVPNNAFPLGTIDRYHSTSKVGLTLPESNVFLTRAHCHGQDSTSSQTEGDFTWMLDHSPLPLFHNIPFHGYFEPTRSSVIGTLCSPFSSLEYCPWSYHDYLVL
jgi:hypothetical protein